jgi:uncharacterized protein (TIGR03086 family)
VTPLDELRLAIGYASASARPVTPRLLSRPTPCAAWTLEMLLSHVSESLDALAEGLGGGAVSLIPARADIPEAEPAGMRVRCARLLAAMAAAPPGRVITVADRGLSDSVLACAGAIEIAVHGWDIAAACGAPAPIPAALARGLLEAAPALIPDSARGELFGAPVAPPQLAGPGERLVAFLGRGGETARSVPDK